MATLGPLHSGLYREVVFKYRSKYITQTPLGHHRVASYRVKNNYFGQLAKRPNTLKFGWPYGAFGWPYGAFGWP